MLFRSVWTAPIALLVVAVLVPIAAAQLPEEGGFQVEADVPMILAATAPTSVGFNVTLGCQELVEGAGEADVEVSVGDALEGVAAQPVSVHFGIEDCVGVVSLTKSGTLSVEAGNATALEPFTLTVVATLGDHATEASYEDRVVAYRPGHSLTPAGDQTFQVDGESFSFDLDIRVAANADTMVMFEDRVVSGAAQITGLKAKIFDVAGGETSATHRITFTPGEGPWTEESVQFRNYSHCLGSSDCGEEGEAVITWTFANAAPDPVPDDATTADEAAGEAPGLAPAVALMAVVALAALARRR